MATLKEIFIELVNLQIQKGEEIRNSANHAQNLKEMDIIYSGYKDWDMINSGLLKNGIVLEQFYAMYNKRDLGNAFDDKESFKFKRDDISKGVSEKLQILGIASRSAQTYENKDFLPLSNEFVSIIRVQTSQKSQTKNNMKKVFISHAYADREIVNHLVDLLRDMGLDIEQIFYSSHAAFGVAPGENILERLKTQLNETDLVLFILSENFYKSPVCLCEMGAVWIKTTRQIPIVIPPFKRSDIKGAIPTTTLCLGIENKSNMNSLQNTIQTEFNLKSLHPDFWEDKRDKYLKSVSTLIVV